MSTVFEERTFVSRAGNVLGKALIPADWSASGGIDENWQGEMVPFVATMNAGSPDGGIYMRTSSKDVHTDLRNAFLKTVAVLVQQHTEAGYDKYIEPEAYIRNWAEGYAGVPLQLTAVADLPTVLASQPELARGLLENDKSLYDMFLEMNSTIESAECFSRLYRFSGRQGDNEIIVLAGMDYQCARLVYGPAILNDFSDSMKKLYTAAREKFNLSGENDYVEKARENIRRFKETASKMTFSDYMNGGILGKMKEQKKQQTPVQVSQRVAVKKEEPGEKRVDLVLWGSQHRYGCLFFADREKEATGVFLNFVRSIQQDESLDVRENNAINRKMQLIRQQAAINQNIALQKTAQLRRMQAKTSRMIARNSRLASEGLMDSFNKKMASDSRISQGFSEATMGVNSYTNSYGQTVDVSTAADHVYENRYGDVYGVSGVELDQETLNGLNWKKIG